MTVRTCLVAGWLSCLGASVVAPMAGADEIVPYEPGRINLEASEPAPGPMSNQQTAEAVATALSGNSLLKGYRIDVVVVEEVAELHGQVLDAAQRDIAYRTAMSVPGIAQVRDHLSLTNREIVPTSQDVVPNLPPGGGPAFPPAPNQVGPQFGPQFSPTMPIPNNAYTPEPAMMSHGQPGMLPNPQYQPPPMPPYAWPTYAPYNNYSRVAYPKQYSHSQWPFIGPMYPYPKVPLGWRRVTLEWQDGAWWYGRESTSHDWWRVRYW
jgi:hypothetical protein